MPNYILKEYDLNKYTFSIYANEDKKKWWEILNQTNNDIICNLSYFGLVMHNYQSDVMIDGDWKYGPSYESYGLAINKSGVPVPAISSNLDNSIKDFVAGLPCYRWKGKNTKEENVKTNGVTFLAIDEAMSRMTILISDRDYGMTSSEAINILDTNTAGDIHYIFRMDGSWSSHGKLDTCSIAQPSQYRTDLVYLVGKEKDVLRYKKNARIGIYSTNDSIVQFASSFIARRCVEAEIIPLVYTESPVKLDDATIADRANACEVDMLIQIEFTETDTYVTTSAAGDTAARNIFASLVESMIPHGERKYDKTNKVLVKAKAPAIKFNIDSRPSNGSTRNVSSDIEGLCTAINTHFGLFEDPYYPYFNKAVEEGIIEKNVDVNDNITYGMLAKILHKTKLI